MCPTTKDAVAGGKIGRLEVFSFGCGEISTNILFSITTVLLVFFYTDVVGVSAAAVGAIIGISQIFNGVSDIAAGLVVDRTRSRHGHARVWLLRMSVPYAAAFILLMTVPQAAENVRLVYIFITYNLLMTVVYTMLQISFSTLLTFMTWDQAERSRLNVVRMTMSPLANIAVTLTFLKIVNALGGNQAAWVKVTAVYAVLAAGLMLWCYSHTRERLDIGDGLDGEKLPVGTALRVLAQNKYFWIITLYFICTALYMTFNGTMLTYYCKYLLNNEELMGTINMAGQLVMLVGIPLTGAALRRFNKRTLCICGCVLIILGSFMVQFNPSSPGLVMASSFVRGFGFSATYALIYVMIADVVEYGHWKTGIRSPGVILSSASCGQKIGSGAGSALIGLIMEYSGYNGLAEVQPAAATATIYDLYVFGAALIGLAMIVILLFYHLDAEYPAIMEQLMKRSRNSSAD